MLKHVFSLSALALQTRALEVLQSDGCAVVGETCGVKGLVYPPCCDGMRCSHTFLGVGSCTKSLSQLGEPDLACAAQGSSCGVGAEINNCCEGSECKAYHESFVCMSGDSACVPDGRVCGFDGSERLGACCGGSSCRNDTGGVMRCMSHQDMCASEKAVCSVDGNAFPKCCGDLTCTKTFNGVGKCKPIRANKACAAQGSFCGQGSEPAQCCRDLKCDMKTGEQHCRRDGYVCVPSGKTCGVPGSLERAKCCGGKTCKQDRKDTLWKCS